MGGIGSSRWNDQTCRPTFGDVACSLPVSGLITLLEARHGPDCFRATQDDSWIQVRVSGEPGGRRLLALDYSVRPAAGACVRVSQSIAAEPLAQPFGGVRWWLLCPSCRTRRAALYRMQGASEFRCRVCQDIAYESQRRDRLGRLQERILRLERRMTADPRRCWGDPTPRRPKGMHRRRYFTYHTERARLYDELSCQMAADFDRISGAVASRRRNQRSGRDAGRS